MKQDQTNRILFRSLHGKYTGCYCVPVQFRCLSSRAIPQAVWQNSCTIAWYYHFQCTKQAKEGFKKFPPSRGVEDYTFSIRIYVPFPFFHSNVNLTDYLLCLRFFFFEIFIKYFESTGPLAPFKNDPPKKIVADVLFAPISPTHFPNPLRLHCARLLQWAK